MSGHEIESDGPWPMGWIWAVVAAVIGAVLARWLGDVSVGVALLVAVVVFTIFAVLLAQFWEAPAGEDHGHGHGHGHDDHGHGHSHDDHAAAAAPVQHAPAPVAAAPAPVAAAPAAPVAAAPAPVAPVPAAPVAAAPAAPVAPAPAPAVAAAPAPASSEPAKPQALTGPRGGKADNLQEIEGIGPALEKLCHDLGVYHFDQIAGWAAGEIAWMDGNLKGFKGRVTRDKWVAQAKIIVTEGVEAFRIRAKSNDY